MVCGSGFYITIKNNQLCGFTDFDGACYFFQMCLICHMDGMCLKRFLQGYTLIGQSSGKILAQLISRILLNMPSRHSYLNTCKTVSGIDRKVGTVSTHHAIVYQGLTWITSCMLWTPPPYPPASNWPHGLWGNTAREA